MNEPLTDERLAEIQAAMREPDFKEVYRTYFHPVVIELDRVFADNERLRAENERLLEEILELKMKPVFDEYREYRA